MYAEKLENPDFEQIKLNLQMGIFLLEETQDADINLASFVKYNFCGTLHCAAGLFAENEFFNQQGLFMHERDEIPGLMDETGNINTNVPVEKVLAIFFGPDAYNRYFQRRNEGLYDVSILGLKGEDISDRELAIARLKIGLKN